MLGGIESRKKVVKIGDGNIAMAIQIARMLKMKFKDSVSIEIVDEHGTSCCKILMPTGVDTG